MLGVGLALPNTTYAAHTGEIVHFELVQAGNESSHNNSHSHGQTGHRWVALEDESEENNIIFETSLAPTLYLETLEVKPNMHSTSPFLFPAKRGLKEFISQSLNKPVVEFALSQRFEFLIGSISDETPKLNHGTTQTYSTVAGLAGEKKSFRIRPPPSFIS